jgi:hypothetical protein
MYNIDSTGVLGKSGVDFNCRTRKIAPCFHAVHATISLFSSNDQPERLGRCPLYIRTEHIVENTKAGVLSDTPRSETKLCLHS